MTAPKSADAPRRVTIGVVSKPHGIHGAIRIKAFNTATELLTKGTVLWLTRPLDESEAPARGAKGKAKREPVAEKVTVRSARPIKDGMFVVELEGAAIPSDPEALEELRGAELSVDRDAMPALGPGEFYHCDLPGYAALDAQGARFGTVLEVLSYPSVDAIAIEVTEGERTIEVPVVEGFLLGVDHAARAVQVDRDMLDGDDK